MKKVFLFLLAAWVCVSLCACAFFRDADGEIPSDTTENDTTEAEDTSFPDTEGTDPVPPQKSPVDIETLGGVVIVGEIGFDEAGWHIIPEQPLNITYTYFYEKPSVFPGQTSIRLIDPKVDGMDKSVYLGQTVTVHGEFRFVRNDFETLYLLPYTITVGKTVEESYGDSTLKAPEGPCDLYDPSTPLPKYLEPSILQGKYIYNAFMLSEETIRFMGNDFTSFYCDFVDAFLSYRSEVPCPDERYAEMLGSVIYYDFPLFDACAEPFEFIKHYDGETDTIRIEYRYGEAEHRQLLDEFLEAADELLSGVTPDMSDVERAKAIYHALCTRMTYDDSALVDFERKNSYYAYLNNSGVCVTFANVYNQLLTQVGIKSTLASCDYSATMGHVWSVVNMAGKDYFCDPTFELSYDKGSGYKFFGMNYADRTKDGLGKDGIRAGKYCFSYTVLPEMIAEHTIGR